MLSEPRFLQLDRARLDRVLVQRALAVAAPRAAELAAAHAAFTARGRTRRLEGSSQALVDALCREFVLGAKRVRLRDEPRPHRRRRGRIVYELHGECRRDGEIEVFVRTAAFQRPIALLSLLETLLHEFVHHHDFDSFGASVHCRGFYERLGQLYRPLRDSLQEAAP